ncbi:hypothetical protein ATANTOWER_020130 [Ataeniobius toweri]|uniref:Uncharacterized protein n=1 Tax=Ataeniobius toweri TaxID=208326 RepID=A0ABU7C8J7_9TELE|nr:hypothetical protein [Ataeniobius toweri]
MKIFFISNHRNISPSPPRARLAVCAAAADFQERWPVFFSEALIKEEFRRITTFHLERTFLTKPDLYTPKLLELFSKKGGVPGTKISNMLNLDGTP